MITTARKTIKVQVVLFASVRELFENSNFNMEVAENTSVKELQDLLFNKKEWNELLLYAINHSYVKEDAVLKEGDEIAFMPFVSGG